jgi:hypothetical protein
MTEATCRRELELEIPAETVQKAVARVAKESMGAFAEHVREMTPEDMKGR